MYNIFKTDNINIRDAIDYNKGIDRYQENLFKESLELLEQTGGEDAFIKIKYFILKYKICVFN